MLGWGREGSSGVEVKEGGEVREGEGGEVGAVEGVGVEVEDGFFGGGCGGGDGGFGEAGADYDKVEVGWVDWWVG